MHLEVTLAGWYGREKQNYGDAKRIIERQLRAELGDTPQVFVVSNEREAEDDEARMLYERMKAQEKEAEAVD